MKTKNVGVNEIVKAFYLTPRLFGELPSKNSGNIGKNRSEVK